MDLLASILLAATACMAVNFLFSLLAFKKPAPPDKNNSGESFLSILVPARNEAGRIEPCIESLLAQRHVRFELIVLDDQSTDGTAEVAGRWAAQDSRLKVVRGAPLPEGWVGKCWAAHQLAKHASGDFLIFTDADTRHEPETAAHAIAEMERGGADMLSLWPRQITGSWSEVWVIPLIYVLILALRPHWMERYFMHPSLGAANGQFVMFRKKTYDAIGGHYAVRGHLVEDIALSRLVLSKGFKLVNLDGSDLVSCRMYENFHQVWEGFTKNLRAAFDGQPLAFLFFNFGVMAVLVMPFLIIPSTIFFQPSLASVKIVLCACIIWLVRLIMALRFHNPVYSAWLQPFGQMLIFIIALNSWRKLSAGGVLWKGRTYTSS